MSGVGRGSSSSSTSSAAGTQTRAARPAVPLRPMLSDGWHLRAVAPASMDTPTEQVLPTWSELGLAEELLVAVR